MAVARTELLLREPQFPASEKASSPPSLKIGPNSLDLLVDLSTLDEHNRFAKRYEETCFGKVLEELGPDQVAYGAHLLNDALVGIPIAEDERVSVPDAMVGTIVSIQENGKPIIELRKIIEARTGKINGGGKLKGFSILAAVIRRSPDYFPMAFEKVMNGRGNGLSPGMLLAPPDSEIDVIFYSPRDQEANDGMMRQVNINGHPFRSVTYETVPLEVFPAAA